jgi:type I restriction enzyme M protein
LAAIDAQTRPGELITAVGDDLLARFRDLPPLDEYDVYEQLLSYWHATLHDDVFLVMREGWQQAATPRAALEIGKDKDGKPKYEDADLQFGTGARAERWVLDLIPPALIAERFLLDMVAARAEAVRAAELAAGELADFISEHAVEGGLLWDAVDDKGKVTDKSLNAAIDELDGDDAEAGAAMREAKRLIKADRDAAKAAKAAKLALDRAVLERARGLTADEARELALEDKWRATVGARVVAEADALTLALVARVSELGARYAATVFDLEAELRDAGSRVEAHLDAIGAL